MENKQRIANLLADALRETRAGEDITTIDIKGEDAVVNFRNGYKKTVNIACDSGLSMMRDILNAIS